MLSSLRPEMELMKSKLSPILIICFELLCSGASAYEPPKLVLAIVVDQMRYDYLERSPHLLATNGFRLLIERGETSAAPLLRAVLSRDRNAATETAS